MSGCSSQGWLGPPGRIAAAARARRVLFYRRVALRDGNAYLVDHLSFVSLMGPDGGLIDLLSPGTRATDIAASIRSRIGWER
jgi:protein SCO1